MSKTVSLTISGQKFTVSQAEAKSISEQLRTAAAELDRALNFSQGREEQSGVIAVSRLADNPNATDC